MFRYLDNAQTVHTTVYTCMIVPTHPHALSDEITRIPLQLCIQPGHLSPFRFFTRFDPFDVKEPLGLSRRARARTRTGARIDG